MRFVSILAWLSALIGHVVLFTGYAKVPYWILISFAVLSCILFFAQAGIEKTPGYGSLAATLLFLNWAGGEWVYQTWDAKSAFIDPVIIARFFGVLGLMTVFFIVFAYHRHFFSYKRTKGRTRDIRQMEIFAPYVQAWERFIQQFKGSTEDKGEHEAIYFTLGKVVEEDE